MSTAHPLAPRQAVRIRRVAQDDMHPTPVKDAGERTIWYDACGVAAAGEGSALLERLPNLRYTGVLMDAALWARLAPTLPARMQKIVDLPTMDALAAWLPQDAASAEGAIVASASSDVLAAARAAGHPTCFRAFVDDAASLHEAIAVGSRHPYLIIRFRDPTNIPLELVIASLQATATVLIKEIADPADLEDAIVSLGVMEVGADGVMYSPREHQRLDALSARLDANSCVNVAIEVGTVIRTATAGMGYRACLDLVTLFEPTEGMLVGSTSQGGILCCPEVFYLPYMELRPFRVNAGAVHSYVYNVGDRTDYMSELKAGAPVMIVGLDGKARRASVGRAKIEVRPLRLIEAEFSGGRRINVIMQDDWHVRVFGADGQPLNITALKPGDKILGHVAQPGRHVGIRIDEHIIEQ